jgi:hypothetical protein
MRKGKIVYDGLPSKLSETDAREIYGGGEPGDEEVELALTATSAPAVKRLPASRTGTDTRNRSA